MDFNKFGMEIAGPFIAGAFSELAFDVFGAAQEFFTAPH